MSSWLEKYFCGRYQEELEKANNVILQYKARYGELKQIQIPTYVVTDTWIRNKVSTVCPLSYVPSDARYKITDQNTFINTILADDWVHTLQYIPEYFDCDDFALTFKVVTAKLVFNITVALIYDWSAGHAYNMAIFPTGNLMLIEPQTATIFSLSQRNQSLYTLKEGMILF